jgi:hypothetical protein
MTTLHAEPTIGVIDQSHARLITVLLCHAKALQVMKKQVLAGMSDRDVSKALDVLMESVVKLYAADGAQLEKEALALAARLGFKVEQVYTSKGSEVLN